MSNMKKLFLKIYFLGFIIFIICACSRSYSVFGFSYPPETKSHESGWKFIGRIIAWDPLFKKPTEKGKRKIQIIIQDKQENKILEEELEFDCASIDKEIIWPTKEKLNIKIFERGNKFSKDEYNKRLIKEGPRLLISLHYSWDGKNYIKEERRTNE